jgi:hypothetical protein
VSPMNKPTVSNRNLTGGSDSTYSGGGGSNNFNGCGGGKSKDPAPSPKSSASASPAQHGSLEELAPAQVGDFDRVRLDSVSNDIGARESAEAEYPTPFGSLYFYVWVYSSSDSAETGMQAVLHSYGQDNPATAPVSVPGSPGNSEGSGIQLYHLQGEQIVWTDDSLLATIDSPSTPYAQTFFDALYGQQWGED